MNTRFSPLPLGRAFGGFLATGLVVAVAALAQPARAMPGEPGAHGGAGMHGQMQGQMHGQMHGQMQGGMKGAMHGGMMGASMGLPLGNPRMAERMLDSVSASDEQRTQIRALVAAARQDMAAQREAGKGLREQAATLFAQPTVDARAAETLRQQMLAQHDSASKRMTQLMLDVSRVLTPEQRQQLATRLAQRRDMMQRQHREHRQPRPQS
jgi:periplasmic protein CpxP/Spy